MRSDRGFFKKSTMDINRPTGKYSNRRPMPLMYEYILVAHNIRASRVLFQTLPGLAQITNARKDPVLSARFLIKKYLDPPN